MQDDIYTVNFHFLSQKIEDNGKLSDIHQSSHRSVSVGGSFVRWVKVSSGSDSVLMVGFVPAGWFCECGQVILDIK
jgi:hypothetical protein